MLSSSVLSLTMDSYVSCIKIRGIPILPPLMTDELREEMRYYKQLALAVEDKLSRLKSASDDDEQNSEKSYYKYHDDKKSVTLSRQESLLSSGIESPDHLSKISSTKRNSELDGTSKTLSEDETLTKSTDINRYMNISDSSKTDETISEAAKPQVPKTLDIIPITVDTAINQRKSSSEMESEEEVPKLVRQGSYTLESPSPMLLAHLEQSTNSMPIPAYNEPKRTSWNLSEVHTEWKIEEKENYYPADYQRLENSYSSTRRNSISENGRKEVSKADKQLAGAIHPVARSVDCIQGMLSKEYVCVTSNYKRNGSDERIKADNDEKVDNNSKSNKDVLILNMSKKLGGSLGSLSNENSPNKEDNNRMTRSFEASHDNYDSNHSYDNKDKPNSNQIKPVSSEKLLYVFKEVQKTHHQQMADLMARQQREQLLMQQEFEKQQMMLLEQLEKSYPGISVPAIVKEIMGESVCIKSESQNAMDSVSLSKVNQNRSDTDMSPLNGSSFDSDESISINYLSTREDSFSESKIDGDRRKSNASRRLFPDEKNVTPPVTNGSICDEKHINAATIINAYARGYLVRRLMKTERVITLKNTYREALHCMLKLHVDAPWELPELNFHKRLQHQCDAASISIVELFAQNAGKRMEIIYQDRQIKKSRQERPSSARSSYSFATQRTLARKKFKELGIPQLPKAARRNCTVRTRCQTWTSNSREKRSPALINQGIKRSTSAGTVRKPWR